MQAAHFESWGKGFLFREDETFDFLVMTAILTSLVLLLLGHMIVMVAPQLASSPDLSSHHGSNTATCLRTKAFKDAYTILIDDN